MAEASGAYEYRLPTKAEFLANGVVTCTVESPCPAGIQCSICTEDCGGPPADILQLIPCSHYFHEECIQSWFASSQLMRGTCPNCRTDLFQTEELDDAQVQQLEGPLSTLTIGYFSPELIRHIKDHLEHFLILENAATEVDDIFHNWIVLADDRMDLERWQPLLRLYDTDQSFDLAYTIGQEMDRARVKYIVTITTVLRASFTSIRARLAIIRENCINHKTGELREVDTDIDTDINTVIDEMEARMSRSTTDELGRMKGKILIITGQVNDLGRKYILHEPYAYLFAPWTGQENDDRMDEEVLDEVQHAMDELDRFFEHDVSL